MKHAGRARSVSRWLIDTIATVSAKRARSVRIASVVR